MIPAAPCDDPNCFWCAGKRANNTSNPATVKENDMTAAASVTVATKTRTVKEFALTIDADTASKLYDILTRHVAGHGLAELTSGLTAAGVDTYRKYKNLNKSPSGYGNHPLSFADLRPVE